MYPLKFKPLVKSLVWGGNKIAPFKGITTEEKNIGESWEISAVEGSVSVVSNGPLAGKDLVEVTKEYGSKLVGKHVYEQFGDTFPLLIKFIDAKDDLSIQVHPNDELAQKIGPGLKGKTEMWYIVEADKGAHLLSGLSKEITPDEYETRVKDNTITDVLTRYEVAPGDVFFLPAGRIHAIGAGTFVAEIQQTSNITYRIYDYGRVGLDGKPRELHVEEAKKAIDYHVESDYKTKYSPKKDEETPLVDCKYFNTSLFDIDKPFTKDLSSVDSFVVVMCINGFGCLVDKESDGTVHEVSLRKGETVLVPASSTSIEFVPEPSLSSSSAAMTCLTSLVD